MRAQQVLHQQACVRLNGVVFVMLYNTIGSLSVPIYYDMQPKIRMEE